MRNSTRIKGLTIAAKMSKPGKKDQKLGCASYGFYLYKVLIFREHFSL
mgnify:CR=1 FL=1